MLMGPGARWPAIAVVMATLTGCGARTRRGADDPPTSATSQATRPTAPRIGEDVWVALAGLPRSHMMRAREMFVVHQRQDAAQDFEAAGALVRLEAAHTDDVGLGHRLQSAGIELRELGRSLQRGGNVPIEEVDDVMTRAYLALAEEHGKQAARMFRDGQAMSAGTYMGQSAAELERAYERSSVTLTKGTRSTLVDAREAARRISNGGSPDAIKVARAALGALEKDSTRLENALGARGR